MKEPRVFLALLSVAIAAWNGGEAIICYEQPSIKVDELLTFAGAIKALNDSLNSINNVKCQGECYFASACYNKAFGKFTNVRGCKEEGFFPIKNCVGVQQCRGILCNGPNMNAAYAKWETTFNDDDLGKELLVPSSYALHSHEKKGQTSAERNSHVYDAVLPEIGLIDHAADKGQAVYEINDVVNNTAAKRPSMCYVQATVTKWAWPNGTQLGPEEIANLNEEKEKLTIDDKCKHRKCFVAAKCSYGSKFEMINVRDCYTGEITALCENVQICHGSLCNAPPTPTPAPPSTISPTPSPTPVPSGAVSNGPALLVLLFSCLLPLLLLSFPFKAKME